MFRFENKREIKDSYDVIVIGGGPAGVAASIYAKRSGADTLVIDSSKIGGNISNTWLVENYPGFKSISGQELGERFKDQLLYLGVDILEYSPVRKVDLKNKRIETYNRTLSSSSIVLAMGVKSKTLGVPGEERFFGKGVSTCAICDAPFYKDKIVAVVGGGDSAIKEGIFISEFVRKMYLIHRRDVFRAEQANVDKLKAKNNVEFLLNSVVVEMYGDEQLQGIKLRNVLTNQITDLKVDGVFIFIGYSPNVDIVRGQLELKDDYIVTDQNYQTSVEGVFAAGDIRYGSFKQLINALAEGAVAGYNAAHYSQNLR